MSALVTTGAADCATRAALKGRATTINVTTITVTTSAPRTKASPRRTRWNAEDIEILLVWQPIASHPCRWYASIKKTVYSSCPPCPPWWRAFVSFLLRQREHVQRVAVLRVLQLGRQRARHQARALETAAAGRDRDVLASADAERHRVALDRRA